MVQPRCRTSDGQACPRGRDRCGIPTVVPIRVRRSAHWIEGSAQLVGPRGGAPNSTSVLPGAGERDNLACGSAGGREVGRSRGHGFPSANALRGGEHTSGQDLARLRGLDARTKESAVLVRLGRDGDLGVVAEYERRAIGAAWIRRFDGNDLEPVDDPSIPVMAIGIESDHRSVGIGGLLLDGLIASARLANVEVIALTTNVWNEAALRLYARRGFEESSRGDKAVRMHLRLS